MVLVGEEHADVPREALQEEDSKEDIGELGWFATAKGFNSVQKLHPLKVGELMAGQQRLLQLAVGLHWIRSNYQVNNSLQGLFI